MAPRRVGLLIPVLLMLQACSTTPFGRQLADSFDPPPAPPSATANTQPKPQEPEPQRQGPGGDTAAATPKPADTAKTQAPVQPTTVQPQPYRITIRLSGADPAAPAERVTQSLREAGIPFEVETIERISPPRGAASGDTSSPAATP